MTEGNENIYADLAKKIDDQARFTRGVSVVCTLSILGVMFYSLTSIVASLPDLVLAKFMSNLDKFAAEYRLIEKSEPARSVASPTPPSPDSP